MKTILFAGLDWTESHQSAVIAIGVLTVFAAVCTAAYLLGGAL